MSEARAEITLFQNGPPFLSFSRFSQHMEAEAERIITEVNRIDACIILDLYVQLAEC